MKITKKELIKSIKKVVNYLYKDELRNYEEYDEDSKERKLHIFNDIIVLQGYTKQSNARNNKKG